MTIRSNKRIGFTLIELLIAITIFATISTLAVTGLRALIQARSQQSQHTEQLRQLQVTYAVIKRDIAQIINRPIRDPQNVVHAGFLGFAFGDRPGITDDAAQTLFEFTRLGYVNPKSRLPRATLERVRYSLFKNQLIRTVWPQLDNIDEAQGVSLTLLDRVENAKLAYIDVLGNFSVNWLIDFAGLEVDKPQGLPVHKDLPAALQFDLTVKDFGAIDWYWLLPAGRRYAS